MVNPFTPGFGLEPAHMGRRPEVEGALLRILGVLRSRRSGAHAALLYGPRGNGKTVLLNWFEKQARGADVGEPVALVRFSSRDLGSTERMSDAIGLAATQWESLWEGLRQTPLTASVSIPVLSVQMGSGVRESSRPAFRSWLAKGDGPLLLTIDEAHEADPEALGDFLDAVQIAGRDRPLAVVLAGTPGVFATLGETHASFWGIWKELRIGLLSDDAARDALSEPFHKAGVETERDTVATLAASADNYPYFIQLYGEAAWDMLAASGERRLHDAHVSAVLDTVRTSRSAYYRIRREEFRRQNLLPLARDVALAFRTASAEGLRFAALTEVLSRHGENPIELEDFLVAKGYIWQDEDDALWTPGIPSLMDYMIEQIESETYLEPKP